jgi:nicotinate-nucleotide adenylyltransferase
VKLGLFGGSFNPPHLGHINLVSTIQRKGALDKVWVIPNYQNPLKGDVEGATPEERTELTRLAFADLAPKVEVLDTEILRKGKSYTIDTLKDLKKQNLTDEFFIILGVDHLFSLNLWKSWENLLNEANFIFTSRPGFSLPETLDDIPEFIKPLCASFDFNILSLKSGRQVEFIQLKDHPASSSEIRKRLGSGRSVSEFLPLSVEQAIKKKGLYPEIKSKVGDTQDFVKFCYYFLAEKKAVNQLAYDFSHMNKLYDFIIIASGTNTRQVSALAEALALEVKREFRILPLSIEGLSEGRWVLIDYGFLIVHLFYDFIRQEYALEELVSQAKPLFKELKN